MGIATGPGMIIVAIGVWIRDLFDKPTDWAPWYAAAVAGTVLVGLGAVYSFAYFFTGVPDWLRPPSQRGALSVGQRRRQEPRERR